ncbi:BA75_00449T0 [Komagataella pastoris]|uniref:BA75_00449T0 n=1 Tax=Komagataella pastoris TaxID=4922 RepID=A0A1B2J6M4_PICPA|nr:BA75_00449T0 [Komagataella pastoris]
MENPLQIIDISNIDVPTAREVVSAAGSQGFLMLEGHGFSQEEVAELFKVSKGYFEEPLEEKKKYTIPANDNHGYTTFGGENLDESNPDKPQGDPKEGYNFSNLNLLEGTWNGATPEYFQKSEHARVVQSVIKKYSLLVHKLLALFAIGLEIDKEAGGADWFVERHKLTEPSGTTFRLLHYPSPKSLNPEETIRAGAHTDYGGVTLLFQQDGQAGLEIHSPLTKKWTPVPYVDASAKFKEQGAAAPIIVNIGDQLSYWTNGLLKSTVHRVKFPEESVREGKSRYSIVFFSHPADDTLLEPVPSPFIRAVNGRGAGAQSKAITAKEHLLKRLAATYGWY